MASYDLDFKKLKAKYYDSIISLDEYIRGLSRLLMSLKRYVFYPLQHNTNISSLNYSNHSMKLYKVIKEEIKRYS